VDTALDKIVEWIRRQARAFTARATGPRNAEADSGRAPPRTFEEIRQRTKERLSNRLGGERSRTEVEQAITQTLTEVRPWGVRALHLERPDSNGASEVSIEVNPRGRLAVILPEARQATMRLVARITVDPDFDLTAASMRYTTRPAMQAGRMVSYATTGFGTAIFPPSPGDRELRVESWNTNERGRYHGPSHAEQQMADWLGRQVWMDRVVHLRVENYWFNPCGGCGGALVKLLGNINQARSDRGRTASASGELTWSGDDPWVNEMASHGVPVDANRALQEIHYTIAAMRLGKWTVTPTTVSAVGREKLLKAFRIE
jgi:hypothetical protein